MKKAVNLAAKIEALKVEYAQARAQEKQHAGRAAKRTITRAARASGLMALVLSGTLSMDTLRQEFIAVTERVADKQTKAEGPEYEADKPDPGSVMDAQSDTQAFVQVEKR